MGKLTQEIAQEVCLSLIAWSKISVSAFTGKGMMLQAVPIEPSLSQSSTGSNNGGVALYTSNALVEHHKVLSLEHCHAMSIGFQVVEQRDRGNTELRSQLLRIDDPRQVRRFTTTVNHRAGDAEAGLSG